MKKNICKWTIIFTIVVTIMPLGSIIFRFAGYAITFSDQFPNANTAEKIAYQFNKLPTDVISEADLSTVYLSLYNCLLTDITGIEIFVNLTELNLEGNLLTSLPNRIDQLTSLSTLDLYNNKLTTLPETIGNLTSLKRLYLDNNLLTSLPSNIVNLTSLNMLSIDYNEISTLPENIGNLSSLTELYANDNLLTSLPSSFGNLKSLHTLHLKNNMLKLLPENIDDLKALTYLTLINNNIEALPKNIGNMKVLTYLNLANNHLKTLPESLGNMSSLLNLNLSGNYLKRPPESIFQLKTLRYLNLDNNQIKELPNSIGNLSSLMYLELCDNEILDLPDSFINLSSLVFLDLVSNQLVTIPESLIQLTSLNDLYLDDNHIVNVPESIKNHQAFSSLELRNNLLPSNYVEIVNHHGSVQWALRPLRQDQLKIKDGVVSFKITKQKDLDDILITSIVQRVDEKPLRQDIQYQFENLVNEDNIPVTFDDYMVDGIVRTEGKTKVQVRIFRPGIFEQGISDAALTIDQVELSFEKATYLVIFDLNDETHSEYITQTVKYGEKIVQPEGEPKRDGFVFSGWNTKADGSGEMWDFSVSVMPENNLVLYAQWQESNLPDTAQTDSVFVGIAMVMVGLMSIRLASKKQSSSDS